ncbi:MAG: hypothetical protein PHD82_09065, partial [Candidatus Riflebacteria bacterium]|nr:hypothetical protein [Candidatus Riflebacteria bacterium]
MRTISTGIFILRSPLHDIERSRPATEDLLAAANQLFDCKITPKFTPEEFDLMIILVLTGGTENIFLSHWPALKASGTPFLLAATTTDNSLPAALEILSWLNANEPGSGAAVVHGNAGSIASQIENFIARMRAGSALESQVAGIIGPPSDWLIASMPDSSIIEQKLGIKLVSISMDQFKKYVEKADSASLGEFAQAFYRPGDSGRTSELARAAKIYGGLTRAVKLHQLNALTLRCFDLLESSQTTGCLALARLNDDGIPAACEGDVPAMLTMMVTKAITKKPGFMANPSSVSGSQVTFAHCTCPVTILEKFSLNNHFESGMGLAVAGEFAPDTFTV